MEDDEFVKLDLKKTSFSELLAHTANTPSQKESLVKSVLLQAQEGEASALKLISQALLDNQFNERETFSITDEKFEQIILLVADHIRAEKV